MTLKISNNRLTAHINPLGAELSSAKCRDGVERIWQGDPAVWRGRAPVLFPVAGSHVGNRYSYRGVEYRMPQHGFAKDSLFAVAAHQPGRLALSLDAPQPNYPFDYRLTVDFSLPEDAAALRIAYIVANIGAEVMYFSLGAHEGFACPEGVAAYEACFPDDDALRHSVLSGAQITGETRDYPLRGGVLPLSPGLFEPDALVFSGLKSRSVTLRSPLHARFVRVDYPDFDNLLLWQKPGAKYVCVEPWLNPPERVDHDGSLTGKPGVRTLQPGEERTYVHTITFG